jgi:diguanylate cyclase (GGDEF)-like protein/PAS domain S-box-containing protein
MKLFSPESWSLLMRSQEKAITMGAPYELELEIITGNGTEGWIWAISEAERDSNGKILSIWGAAQDITERKKIEQQLKSSEERYRCLFNYSGVGVVYYTTEGIVISSNKRSMDILGGERQDITGLSVYEIFSKAQADELFSLIQKTASSDQPIVHETLVAFPSGSKWLSTISTNVKNTQGEVIGVQITSIDITDRKKAEEELRFLSYHDELTGFYNRRFFENELIRLEESGEIPLSVIVCDINGLKLINDSFGHDRGDELLMKAANIIRVACQKYATISRIGGDEFAVLLPGIASDDVLEIVKHIKTESSKEKIANIELSIAIGYDTKTSANQKIGEVLANAENHMYRHKLYDHTSTRSKTIDIIMNTLFEKSNRESLHSDRVSSICMAIAIQMDFTMEDVNKIKIAGLVHDIGKIGIDEKILNKPGSLDVEERSQINKHPEVGWRILSSASEFSELANFILDHHERWDGNGYPNGLKGLSIPIEARIIAVADSYDAMTRDRSYRKGLTKEEAIVELKRCSGTQFDPEIVHIFIEKVLPTEAAQ